MACFFISAFACSPRPVPAAPGDLIDSITTSPPTGFGWSIDAGGGNILVGIPDHSGSQSGEAAVYDSETRAFRFLLGIQVPSRERLFGTWVAIVGDYLAVSDPQAGSGTSGTVHLFSAADGSHVRSIESAVEGDNHQIFNAIAPVGTSLAVAWSNGTGGAVEIFDPATGASSVRISNPESTMTLFGRGLVAVGDMVAVGAPWHHDPETSFTGVVHIFDASTGALLRTISNPDPETNDRFGWSLAALGTDLLIGAPGGENGGRAYLCNPATGDQLAVYTNPEPGSEELFGFSVAAANGHPLIGAAYDRPDGVFQGGRAYLINRTSGATLLTLRKPVPQIGDMFGFAVRGLGEQILVSAPGDQSVDIYEGDAAPAAVKFWNRYE